MAAWNETSATIIASCFNHPGLFPKLFFISSAVEVDRNNTGAKEVEEAEIELEQELRDQLEQLRARDPMTILELLSPIGENETAQPELTENEILEAEKKAQEEGENSGDVAPVADKFTRTEKSVSFVMLAPRSMYPRKVTKLLIKSFATFKLIFATHPPLKLPSTYGLSRFPLSKYKKYTFHKVILPLLIISYNL